MPIVRLWIAELTSKTLMSTRSSNPPVIRRLDKLITTSYHHRHPILEDLLAVNIW